MRNIILGILIVAASLWGADESYAQCGSCIENYFSVYDEFKGSNAVFAGKVVEIKKVEESKNTDTTTNADHYEFKVKFRVETAWKSDMPDTITITNIGSNSSDFKMGKSYLVYAYIRHYAPNVLRAHIGCCSRTKELSEATRDLEELREKGEKPTRIIKAPKSKANPNNGMHPTPFTDSLM